MSCIFTTSEYRDLRKTLRKQLSRAEIALWHALRGEKIGGYKFRRQHSIGRYIVDFYCPKARLVIEVDGEIHALREQQEYDRIRTEWIQQLGIRVVRFRNEEVLNRLEEVCRSILDTLGLPPLPPP